MRAAAGRRERVAAQARYRCGYCQTQEAVSGIPMTLEHLAPQSRGGSGAEENLWLSCRLCNEAKSDKTEAADPETDRTVSLFNPRTQEWSAHFVWTENGTQITGLTPVGRATAQAFSLNSELRVRARAIWVEAGYHPPEP